LQARDFFCSFQTDAGWNRVSRELDLANDIRRLGAPEISPLSDWRRRTISSPPHRTSSRIRWHWH